MFNLGTIYQENGTVDIEQARKWYEKSATLGVQTGWVALIELDFINSTIAKPTNNHDVRCDNIYFTNWIKWKSGENFHANEIYNLPAWLDSYINSEMSETEFNTIALNEEKEMVRLLALVRLFAQWKQNT